MLGRGSVVVPMRRRFDVRRRDHGIREMTRNVITTHVRSQAGACGEREAGRGKRGAGRGKVRVASGRL